ncbi:molybdopterin-binding protein [Neoroseomonas soli]|uniref:Molybdopterin molybdenumtransferase n=1 Tax=Neoroseomonas soli TaxID=1081025 RepID=A0A9X9WT25_9PROT|nr:molybdopterin-binding protein [Neoroseomonas soli]MBR0670304.1 molybdopterin-binding protein [Neoroseomonas soli]
MDSPLRAPAPLRLAPLEDALSAWLALLPAPVAPRRIPAAAAVGRVLAESVQAATPVPAMPVALRDGWAVAAADTLGAGPYSPVVLAGPPLRVRPGDGLPPGTDAVLPPFDLEMTGPFAQAVQPVAPGEGVRRPGEDIAAGTVLRAAGERLRARDLPALAALGSAEAAVRVPRLAWIATGAEIATDPARDTNGPLLALLAAAEGADWSALPPRPGTPENTAAALRAAAPDHDLILLGGGSGEGAEDRSAEGLAAAGRVALHGIGARPGTTAGFGAVGGTPVLILPGRTEDALAAWLLLARPALAALSGLRGAAPAHARLARKVASGIGFAELVPLRVDARGLAEPLAIGALPPGAFAAADAVLVVPPGSEGYEPGADVPVMPL